MNNRVNEQDNTNQQPTGPSPKAGWKEWMGLMVLALPTLLLSLDVTMLHLALPHLAADLQPSSTQQLWILDIYGFMIAGFLVTMGTVGDRIGRKKLLLIGAGAFGIASIVAAYSTSAEILIVTRALLGIAGATLMPSTLALISNMFHNAGERALAIGVWMVCFSAGGVLGPAVGGVLLEFFWWGSVFLMGIPFMLLLLICGPLLLPEYRNPQAGKLDFISVGLSLVAILPVIYGLKEFAKGGLQLLPILAVVAGLAFGWLFVRRQGRLKYPLMDLSLFRNPAFSASLGMLLLGMIVLGAFVLLFAQYLQLVKGLSPVQAGLWMIPFAIGSIIGIMAAPIIAKRMPPPYLIAIGLILAAIGYLMLIQADANSAITLPVAGSVLLLIGTGPLQVLAMNLVIGAAPPEKAGSAASLSETSGELGMALGIASLGSVGTAVYRNQVQVPGTVPAEAAEAARDTLAGAVAAADQLPAHTAAELLAPAREAFTTGMVVVGWLSVAALLGLAILAVTLLRHVRPISEADEGRVGAGTPARTEEA